MNVSYIKEKDFKHISELWFKSFQYNFYTIIGKNFILKYLKISYVLNKKYLFKITQNNQIKGFIIYGNDFFTNKVFIKQYFFSIIFTILKKFFSFKIFKTIYLIKIFFYFIDKKNFSHLSNNNIELIIICIEKKKKRRGLGKNLLKYSSNKIFNTESVKKIFVKTAYPSRKTEQFYKNIGFKFYKKIFHNKWQLLALSR